MFFIIKKNILSLRFSIVSTCFVLFVIVSGCSTNEAMKIQINDANNLSKSYQVKGRMSVSIDNKYDNLGFEINAIADNYKLKFSSALGVWQQNIDIYNNKVIIDNIIIANNFKQWMHREYGWYFPITTLGQIIFGNNLDIGDSWSVSVGSYQNLNGVSYPKIVRFNQSNKDIKIKLSISSITIN